MLGASANPHSAPKTINNPPLTNMNSKQKNVMKESKKKN